MSQSQSPTEEGIKSIITKDNNSNNNQQTNDFQNTRDFQHQYDNNPSYRIKLLKQVNFNH